MTTPYLDRILECKDDDNIVLLRDKGNAETIISARHFKREIEALRAKAALAEEILQTSGRNRKSIIDRTRRGGRRYK